MSPGPPSLRSRTPRRHSTRTHSVNVSVSQDLAPRLPLRICKTCCKKHSGDPPEDNCFEQDLEAKLQNIQSLIKRKKKYCGAKGCYNKKKEEQQKQQAQRIEILNQSDSECFATVSPWTPELCPSG